MAAIPGWNSLAPLGKTLTLPFAVCVDSGAQSVHAETVRFWRDLVSAHATSDRGPSRT